MIEEIQTVILNKIMLTNCANKIKKRINMINKYKVVGYYMIPQLMTNREYETNKKFAKDLLPPQLILRLNWMAREG